MPVSSSAEAAGSNSFNNGYLAANGLNALEVITIAVVGIIFSLIIVSAFRKE